MSILVKESYVNPSTPLWAEAGSGGAAENPIIELRFPTATGIIMQPYTTQELSTALFPSQIVPGDTVCIRVRIFLNDLELEAQVPLGKLTFNLAYSDDGIFGSTVTSQSVLISNTANLMSGYLSLILTGYVAENPGAIQISISNENDTLLYINSMIFDAGFIQKTGSGLIAAP